MCVAVALALVLGLVTPALARSPDDPDASPPAPWTLDLEAALALEPSDAELDTWSLSLVVDARHTFRSGFDLGVVAGVSGMGIEVDGQPARSGVDVGNPVLAAGFSLALQPTLRLRAGLRAGAPLATFPGGIAENRRVEHAYRVANGAHGLRDPLVWEMNAVPIGLELSAWWAASSRASLEARVTTFYAVSVNARPSRLSVAAALLSRWTPLGPLHLEAGLCYFASQEPLMNAELDQLAAQVGAGVRLGHQLVLARFALSLDAPYGIAVDDPQATWGLMLATELAFGASR